MNTIIREASHAGSWYNYKSAELTEELNENLNKALTETKESLRGIIVPHAGYRWSGPTAAYGYSLIDPTLYKRIFILGPSHHTYFKGIGISECTYYNTPLGKLKLDQEIIEKFRKIDNFISLDLEIEEQEHSIEMQLPYLKHIFKDNDVTIVPLMIGATNSDLEAYFGEILSEYYKDKDNLFVISSDFCHWGKRFNYTKTEEADEKWKGIELLDIRAMNTIETNVPKKFEEYLNETKNTICGRRAILIFMNIIRSSSLNSKTEFIKYSQSSKCKNENDSSVSYAVGINYLL